MSTDPLMDAIVEELEDAGYPGPRTPFVVLATACELIARPSNKLMEVMDQYDNNMETYRLLIANKVANALAETLMLQLGDQKIF